MLKWMLPALLAASCWGQVLGTWKLIPAKSRQSSGRLAQAITAKYESRSGAEIWTFYQVRADGISETTSQTLRFDGKEYPCGDLGLEERPDSVISRKLGSGAAEVSYKKSGRVARRVVRTISADGKQMTLEIHITPERGPAVEQRLVFERSKYGTEKLGSAAAAAQQYVISAYAGGAQAPMPAVAGSVGAALGLATDTAGNIYFASGDLNSVFKLDKNGVLTRFARNSRRGYSGDGGPAASSQLQLDGPIALARPARLAVDGVGNVFTAGTGNHSIRRISPSGIITTMAGSEMLPGRVGLLRSGHCKIQPISSFSPNLQRRNS